MGVHWKISLLEEVSQKTNIGGGDCLKGGLRQFADLRGVGEEREGGVFEGGVDTPMHTMKHETSLSKSKEYGKLWSGYLCKYNLCKSVWNLNGPQNNSVSHT